MIAQFVRDAAMVAAVLGFFAFSWFGWAMERPPWRWRLWLTLGMTASFTVMLGGAVTAIEHWNEGTVLTADASRSFGILVGVEFGIAALGAVVLLAVLRSPGLISPWIALVVGVHFFPLAALLGVPVLYVTAALVTAAALGSIVVARRQAVTQSAVTGISTGGILLGTGLLSLVSISLG